MNKTRKSTWYDNTLKINCSVEHLKESLNNIGEHFKEIVCLMPGMKDVELIDQGSDFVTIQTNEGLMKRTNISITSNISKVTIEFDEEYQAGNTIKSNSHFVEDFTALESDVLFKLTISELRATGFLGFLYKNFGSKNIGNAFLQAYKKYLEDNKT